MFFFYYKKSVFLLESQFSYFLNIILDLNTEIFIIFFLTFISLFFLIVYLVRFNTNNKRHFQNMLTHVFNNKQPT